MDDRALRARRGRRRRLLRLRHHDRRGRAGVRQEGGGQQPSAAHPHKRRCCRRPADPRVQAGAGGVRQPRQAQAASRDDPLPDHASRPVPGDGRDQHDPLHFHVPHLVLGRRAPQELRPEARRPHQRCARRAGRGAALHLPHRHPRDPAQHVGNGLVRREPHHARRRPVGRRPEGGRVRRAQGHHRQRSLRVRRRGPQGNAGAGQAGRPGHSRCEPPQGGSDGHP